MARRFVRRWMMPPLGYCMAVAVLVIGASAELHASLLTFDQTLESGNVIPTISGRAVPQDYGDRVTGSPMDVNGGQFTYGESGEGFTPNVVVDYFAGSAVPNNPGVSVWQDLYGDLLNVIFGNQNSNTLNIRLIADPGFSVHLYHFDLAGWPNADYTIHAVRVLDASATLFSQSDVLVQGDFIGPRHTSFVFATPLSGSELLIEIDYSNLGGGQQDNIGIDNVRFGQSPPPGPEPPPPPDEPSSIPGPAAALLVCLGLPGLLVAGSRRPRPILYPMAFTPVVLSAATVALRPSPSSRSSAASTPVSD
jgi:hypothetical protein